MGGIVIPATAQVGRRLVVGQGGGASARTCAAWRSATACSSSRRSAVRSSSRASTTSSCGSATSTRSRPRGTAPRARGCTSSGRTTRISIGRSWSGGTGRSGSTIVGHLLDHHPDLTLTRPMEVRFIAGQRRARRRPRDGHSQAGVRQALRPPRSWRSTGCSTAGSSAPRRSACTRRCPARTWSAGRTQYLVALPAGPAGRHQNSDHPDHGPDRREAGRLATRGHDPANARKADRLEPIYPESDVVVVTRDGRDVAASFVSQTFGPDDVFEALDQWEQRRLRTTPRSTACRRGPGLTIELMDLVVNDRAGSLAGCASAIGVPVDPGMVGGSTRTSRPTAPIPAGGDGTSTPTPARGSTTPTPVPWSASGRPASTVPA